MSPFPALGAAPAFTPQDGHRRGFMFGDTPASSISSPLPPRSQVFAAFDGYEASLLLFTAVAVSGTIGYMTGCNFVGSSCVEVPVAALSHALGFLLHASSDGTRPHPGLLATSALSCWAATSVTTCCTSVTGVVRFGHLPVLLSFMLSVRTFVFLACVALIGVPPTKSYSFYWLQRSPCCGTLHRGPDRV